MNGLNYLLQTNLYLLLFMGFYVLVLRKETFFRQNRFFLNTSIFLSFLIPFINSNWFRELFITQKVREAAIMPTQMMYDTIIVGVNEEASSLSISDAIFWIYASGATFLLLRFLIRLIFLKSKLKAEKGAAFSFFKTLVVDSNMPKAETIIGHEKVHMREWHSADIIFIELAAIVNWFNPVMYLYKKEIRHIHEFIADEEAARLMQSKSDYAMLLFSNTLGFDPLHLSNNFFNKSLLKRRILMLHKNRSRSTGLWKYGFSAPLFILMLIVSAAAASSESNLLSVDGERTIMPIENITTLPLPEAITGKPTKVSKERTTNGYNGGIADQTDLKRHVSKSITYPATAKAVNALGYIQVNFIVKDKKISNVEITKGLHPDLDKNVLDAFASFNSEISIPNNDYSIAVVYLDMEKPVKDQNLNRIPKNLLYAKNYLGEVLAMVKHDGLKGAWTVSTSRADPVTGKQEPIGFDGSSIQDRTPSFPGGMKAWQEYVQKELKYTASARSNNVKGNVIVKFTVEKDGSIGDIKLLRGIGIGADEEAVRVIAQSPKWIPGMIDGKPARVSFTVPINFGGSNPVQISAGRELPENVFDFSTAEVIPEFEGGQAGWGKYLSANLKYPEQARKDSISGRVIVGFIVEKDGTLSDIKVLRGIGGGLDEEAVRVLKNSPAWKPGKILDGSLVRVAYTMPIFFNLGAK